MYNIYAYAICRKRLLTSYKPIYISRNALMPRQKQGNKVAQSEGRIENMSNQTDFNTLQSVVKTQLKGIQSKETGIASAQQTIASAILEAAANKYVVDDNRAVTVSDLDAVWDHGQSGGHDKDIINRIKKAVRETFTDSRPSKDHIADAAKLKAAQADHNAMLSRFNRAFDLACVLAHCGYTHVDYQNGKFMVMVESLIGKDYLPVRKNKGDIVALDNKASILVSYVDKSGGEQYGSVRASVDQLIKSNKVKKSQKQKNDVEKAFEKLAILAKADKKAQANTLQVHEEEGRSILYMLSQYFDKNGNVQPSKQTDENAA